MIKKTITDFGKNLKNYVNYIMKLGFGELFVQFLTLVIVLLLACFVYVPLELVQELFINIIGFLFKSNGTLVFAILDIVINAIQVILTFYTFMYLFNKRYEDVKKDMNKEKEKKVEEDIELPKMK